MLSRDAEHTKKETQFMLLEVETITWEVNGTVDGIDGRLNTAQEKK